MRYARLENLSLRCARLGLACRKWFGVKSIEFCEPARGIGDERFEKNSLGYATDTHAVSLKTKFFGETDCLAAAILEKLGDRFGHLD